MSSWLVGAALHLAFAERVSWRWNEPTKAFKVPTRGEMMLMTSTESLRSFGGDEGPWRVSTVLENHLSASSCLRRLHTSCGARLGMQN